MSGQLLEIHKKIGSVTNTKKITKAMQLVAASKMKQFQKKALMVRGYVWEMLEILERHLGLIEEKEKLSPYMEKRTEGPILFVAYTSDKGLCGGLNTQILRALLRNEKWKNTPADQKLLIAIGKKSKDFARSNKIPVEKSFLKIPEKLKIIDALEIIDEILKYWTEKLCREIVFIAPHFKNSLIFYPIVKTLLPFSKEMIQSHFQYRKNTEDAKKTKLYPYMLYEPSKAHIKNRLFEHIIESIFIHSFFELKASEYSSRMIAMKNANDSADRILHDLTLTYNKTRQQVITQELAELIGASEALAA
ncbi:ATP synthase F1 subunit gamma [Candidatus Peregrinibacteria bacterium]|nr:ATP synthase F1 subunit gamma [Candidatus Peregrinibacteria bacterium]